MKTPGMFLSEEAILERQTPVELSIVMPCFNEAEGIEQVIADWKELLNEEKISHEIILVNDGSTDGTGRNLDKIRKETKSVRVIHQLNAGPSHATRRGYELCRGRFILHAEGNNRFEPLDFLRLWEVRETHPVVLAFRTHRLDSLPRRLSTKLQRWLVRRFFGVTAKDPAVTFRLIRRDASIFALKNTPANTDHLNLWFTVLIAEHWGNAPEVAVPFRTRRSCRIRRTQQGWFSETFSSIREIFIMRYGNADQPGIKKLPKLVTAS